MDRKEAVTILQEKRDLARMLEAAEKSADWAAKDRVDSSSLRASQHGRYADALDMAISALSPPNEWVSVEERLPPEHEPVLCIVNGKPKPNITLEEAYQLGSWNKADGWIIDEYLDWEDAVVLWWMPLPEPPGKEG
ncbi:DUF551 domain-containing protein [Dysosmobacter welbionis]|uniref:DUF551 domain-containing protein n=1 Tax=Dysosmobacter welbionis TaxID=2093857 RepID=UPI002942A18B|nr:DUF551 domain-containing protein [Dysosmobacter welbionis]